MKYRLYMWDLDGTLTDPKIGITKSVQYALAKFGIIVNDRDMLTPFIGPPLKESFQRFYAMTEAEAIQAVAYYREYFGTKGLYENEVYAGIEDILSHIQAQGCINIVVTSKPTLYAEKIVAHFNLNRLFSRVIGSNMDLTMTDKGELIAYALLQFPYDPSACVMIGDREHDIIGAKKNGVDSIGVTWGYGTLDELEKVHVNAVAKSIKDLKSLFS